MVISEPFSTVCKARGHNPACPRRQVLEEIKRAGFGKEMKGRDEREATNLLGVFSFQVGVLQEPVLDHFSFEAPLIADFECWQFLIGQ